MHEARRKAAALNEGQCIRAVELDKHNNRVVAVDVEYDVAIWFDSRRTTVDLYSWSCCFLVPMTGLEQLVDVDS